MPEQPDPSAKTPVTRGQFCIIIAILVGFFLMAILIMEAQITTLKAEQKKYNAGQYEILDGVKKIHNDIDLFTKELIEAKRQQETP